jgi:hypothetical protein
MKLKKTIFLMFLFVSSFSYRASSSDDAVLLYYHGTSGSLENLQIFEQTGIRLKNSKINQDFGSNKGFYLTLDKDQALERAQDQAQRNGHSHLKVLEFQIPKTLLNSYGGTIFQVEQKDWRISQDTFDLYNNWIEEIHATELSYENWQKWITSSRGGENSHDSNWVAGPMCGNPDKDNPVAVGSQLAIFNGNMIKEINAFNSMGSIKKTAKKVAFQEDPLDELYKEICKLIDKEKIDPEVFGLMKETIHNMKNKNIPKILGRKNKAEKKLEQLTKLNLDFQSLFEDSQTLMKESLPIKEISEGTKKSTTAAHQSP